MKEFLLVFRRDFIDKDGPTQEQLQGMMKVWQDWMGSLAAQNKLVNSGSRLSGEGRVVMPDKAVTNGPYVEIKEAIGGYIVVRAASIDEAAELAKGCPILMIKGNVEIRTIIGIGE